jgi:DNA topoisomerase IB
MIAFARALPALRKQVAVDLRRTGLPREKALACAIRLLDQAMFRIGSEVYAKENGSFGLATLRKDHVRIRGNLIVFDFDAKSGRRRVQETRDSAILAAIRSMKRRRNGGPELLAFRKEGGWHDVRSGDINDYLRDAAAGEFTAKDFRTWHATVLGAVSLAAKASEAGGITSRRRLVSASVKEVAEYLGNTPAVARASYIDPRVIDSFEQGVTIAKTLEHVRIDDPTDPSFRDSVEAAVLDLLEDTHSAGARAA